MVALTEMEAEMMGRLPKCPVCGVATFGEVYVPLGGGQTMYIHYASVHKDTDKEILEDMLERLEEEAEKGEAADSEGEFEDATFDLRYEIENALREMPDGQAEPCDTYIALSGCRVDASPTNEGGGGLKCHTG